MLPLVALHSPLADNTDCIFCQETDDIVNLSQYMFYPGGSAGPEERGEGLWGQKSYFHNVFQHKNLASFSLVQLQSNSSRHQCHMLIKLVLNRTFHLQHFKVSKLHLLSDAVWMEQIEQDWMQTILRDLMIGRMQCCILLSVSFFENQWMKDTSFLMNVSKLYKILTLSLVQI